MLVINWDQNGKQSRSRWDGSLWAVIWIYTDCSRSCLCIHGWKLWLVIADKVYHWELSLCWDSGPLLLNKKTNKKKKKTCSINSKSSIKRTGASAQQGMQNRLSMLSAEYSCKLFKSNFAYRQTVWTLIRLLLEEQSDLGPHCLQKWLLKSEADNKADDNCCDWQWHK